MSVAQSHSLEPLDLFGFFFDGVLDAQALPTLKGHTKLLQKLYKATPNKIKTQKFLLTQVRGQGRGGEAPASQVEFLSGPHA